MPTFKVTLTGANFHALRDAINASGATPPPNTPVVLGCTGRGCPIGSPKQAGVPDDTGTTPASTCEIQFASSSQALAWLNFYESLGALPDLSWTGEAGS